MPQLHGVDGGASSASQAPVPSVRSFDAGAGRLPRMPVGGDAGRLRAGGGADRRRNRRDPSRCANGEDRKNVVSGKRGSGRVDPGGRRIHKKKKKEEQAKK